MEKVIDYLEGQPDFSNCNIQRFKEEVAEHDRNFPHECIWDRISNYIDIACGNSDRFLTLFEENYKELCSCLFNNQYALLDDFQNSDSDGNNSDRRDYDQDERNDDNTPNYTRNYSLDNNARNFQPASYEGYGANEDNYNIEDNIYDNDQDDNIQDRCYSRRREDDSDNEDKQSNNDSNYDPLDTSKLKSQPINKNNINNLRPEHFPLMINPGGQIKGMPKFMIKPTFDPRILNQNPNMMPIMVNNPQLPGGLIHGGFPMMGRIPTNGGIPIHMIPTIHQRAQQIAIKHHVAPVKQEISKLPRLNDQPVKQKHNICSIFVKNIPSESNNIGALNAYFTKFGEVTNVSVNPVKSTAVVKFCNPDQARNAYMCKDPVLGVDTIQLIYNPGPLNSYPPSESPAKQKAEIGSNLVFESEEVMKQRELIQKKRNIKKQRKDLLEKKDQEFKMMIKELSTEQSDEKKQEIKDKISQVKKIMAEVKKEEEEEKLKEKKEKKKESEEKIKKLVNKNKYVSEKIKQKIGEEKQESVKRWYSITLKDKDDKMERKMKNVLEKLKLISNNISDCKFGKEFCILVRLLHYNKDKLKEDIEKLGIFELTKLEEQEIDKSKQKFGK